MDAQTLYDELAIQVHNLTKNSTLDADDIRQELMLLCLEVAAGRSAYTPAIGGVHGYIMGRLRGMSQRWKRWKSLDEPMHSVCFDEDGSGNGFGLAELCAPSVEEVLEQRDDLYAQDVVDVEQTRQLRERLSSQSTLSILIQTGHWSIRDAARFTGVSKAMIQKKMSKVQMSINA